MATDYGTGIALWGIDRRLSLLTGPRLVVDDVVCRLTQRLWYAPEYGVNVFGLLNGVLTQTSLSTLGSLIENECTRDDRVASADASAVASGENISIIIKLTLNGGEVFELVGRFSDGTVRSAQFTVVPA